MPDVHANFGVSTVATAPSPATSGTSLVVAAGEGALFPTVPFNATIWPTGVQPTSANAEIVRVTVRSTDTLTITRTQDSTSARTVVVGDQIAATITKKTLTDAESGMTMLADSLLGADAATIDASSLPATYTNLMVVAYLRSARAVASDAVQIRFNGLSTSIYYDESVSAAGTSVTGAEDLAASSGLVGRCPGDSATALRFGTFSVMVANYANTTNHKSYTADSVAPTGTGTGTILRHVTGGVAATTAAVNQVTMSLGAGNDFRSGSRMTVYGLT